MNNYLRMCQLKSHQENGDDASLLYPKRNKIPSIAKDLKQVAFSWVACTNLNWDNRCDDLYGRL
jgi:hypothetical protein